MGGTVSSAAVDRNFEPERATGATDAAIRVIGLLGAALSIAVGAVAIAGWSFDLPVLTRFYSERSAMQPITAMCAILAGAGVLAAIGTRKSRSSSVILAGMIVIAAVQTLIEYGLGVGLGTDGLFFPTSVASQAI